MNKKILLDNRGFAISTILFGTMILFMLLVVSLLSLLSVYHNNLQKLIDDNNGARKTITLEKKGEYATKEAFLEAFAEMPEKEKSGLYCFGQGDDYECTYVSKIGLIDSETFETDVE